MSVTIYATMAAELIAFQINAFRESHTALLTLESTANSCLKKSDSVTYFGSFSLSISHHLPSS